MKTLKLYSFAVTGIILFSSYMIILLGMILLLHK